MLCAAQLAEVLIARSIGRGRYRGPCPHHGGDSFEFFDGRTCLVMHCFAGCSFEEIAGALRDRGIWSKSLYLSSGIEAGAPRIATEDDILEARLHYEVGMADIRRDDDAEWTEDRWTPVFWSDEERRKFNAAKRMLTVAGVI